MVLPVCRIPVSICCAKRRATSFTHVLEVDKPVDHFPRFRPHIFLRAGSVIILCEVWDRRLEYQWIEIDFNSIDYIIIMVAQLPTLIY